MLQPLKATNEAILAGMSNTPPSPHQAILPAVQGAGTVNGSSIDFNGVPLTMAGELTTGAIGGSPTLDVKFQESDTGLSGWSDITGGAFDQVTTANQLQRLAFTRTKRYVRAVSTVGGTSTPTVAVAVLVAGSYSTGLATAYCGLYVNTVPLNDIKTLADLTEASFPGYARVAVTWHPPGVDSAGVPTMLGSQAFFAPSGTVSPTETAYGYFIADSLTGGVLVYPEAFGNGFLFSGPTNQLLITPVYQLPTDQLYGGADVIT